MKSISPIQGAALVAAAALLILQIIGGLEYTVGGSLYAQASMISAMVTVAILPVFIEAARRGKAWGIATALFVAFCAFLAYSLPATVGRTGEVREVKAIEASVSLTSIKLAEEELDKAQARLAEVFAKLDSECGSGFGKRCEGWRTVAAERQTRVDELTKELSAMKPKLGDMGSEAWAWTVAWAGISAETIRRLSSLCFGLGLDVVIWSLMWFATSEKVRGVSTTSSTVSELVTERHQLPEPEVHGISHTPPTPPKRKTKRQAKRDRHVNWVRKYREKHGRSPKLEVVSSVLRIPSTTAYRRMKQAAA